MSSDSLFPLPTRLQSKKLTVFTDGGSRGNPGPAALGVVVKNGEEVLHEISQYLGVKTNNEAEYLAFKASLDWLLSVVETEKPTSLVWKLDSMLVVQQLNRKWKIKEPRMQLFAQEIWSLLIQLKTPYVITYVPRAENAHADLLVNRALDEQVQKTS